MTWKEIKLWATNHGYECKKVDGGYSWSINDTTNISKSISKLARDIFNHMTNNKFIEHQRLYERNK